MKSTFGGGKGMSSMSEINVTPLLDLAFVLLIIFMISTPMMKQNEKESPIPVNLPITSGAPGSAEDKDKFQDLSVDKTGRMFFGRDAVSEIEMDRRLAQLATSAKPPVLSIRGDKDGKYQNVVTLLNLVKKNKLSRISLDTEIKN